MGCVELGKIPACSDLACVRARYVIPASCNYTKKARKAEGRQKLPDELVVKTAPAGCATNPSAFQANFSTGQHTSGCQASSFAIMISLIHRIYTRVLIDGIGDLIWTIELSPQEKEGIAKLNRWRSGQLNHDDTLLDSDKRYLLLVANERVFLVERNGNWKRELDERDLDLYARKGRASFRRIRRQPHQKKTNANKP